MKSVVSPPLATLDANDATASVAYRMNEVIAIYPITPSSPMAETADEWSARGKSNLWGMVPQVVELQSEGGVAGALHGALQAGALCTSFSASQGLLLIIPNMYKIAGELNPFCLHVTARTLATHALSIFGDHSDVMACRQTGFALLAACSVQEAHDFACIAQAATLESRVPYLHFFDGFRTSHEVNKIEMLTDEVLRAMVDEKTLAAHRARAMTPDKPTLRGTAQNPDVFFQAREASNPFHANAVEITQKAMDRFAQLTGRAYHVFDYEGHPEADRVIVIMGSGAETAAVTAGWMGENGEKTGVLKVRLFRPFDVKRFLAALPASVRSIAVLDRTKEPGATGEPLYQDVITALREGAGQNPALNEIKVIGGRYGLGSKEFTPAMVKAVYDELASSDSKNHFTVGINDDVSGTSLRVDDSFDIEAPEVVRALFYGLGADGTVGANKNTIKIIGEETENHAQGYFVYDSKKSGAMTISHLRFGPKRIRAPYLINKAGFVACHHARFVEQIDILENAAPGAVFLLNTPLDPSEVWDSLPGDTQETIREKKIKVHVIDAYRIATENGMRGRINTIMQVCFFALAQVLPTEVAIEKIKNAIEKTYGKKGRKIVEQNFAVVDQALAGLHEVPHGEKSSAKKRPLPVPVEAPDFVQRVIGTMIANKGNLLPVSAFTPDGVWPTATTQWEKRNLAETIPVWDASICIQCNKCVAVCPHAAIRAKYYQPELLEGAPATFQSTEFRSREMPGLKYTLQVAPEDCTGCELCVNVCPVKNKANPRRRAINMEPQMPLRDQERENYRFFLDLPSPDRATIKMDPKNVQFLDPLFEYSGACAGCGETPYVKLLTQLFGDRLFIANATGCSSIYGGNLPTTPYTVDREGRGPTWSNSLFEDNAEFGLGFRLAVDHLTGEARALTRQLAPQIGDEAVAALLNASMDTEAEIAAQRKRVADLKKALAGLKQPEAGRLAGIADYLVKKSVWVMGGDGWAYDIGYGGLDHVLASGHNVKVLVLDTEVYSNTGGQCSKSTPLAASAKFSASGKAMGKKDLALMAISYGSVYVAKIAMGAKDAQTVKAFVEAESFPGPALIIAYSHCIAHGIQMHHGMDQQKLAVETGSWPLFRYDPRRVGDGENPFQLDSASPKLPLTAYTQNELRYRLLEKSDPERSQMLIGKAQENVRQKFAFYEQMARFASVSNGNGKSQASEKSKENS